MKKRILIISILFMMVMLFSMIVTNNCVMAIEGDDIAKIKETGYESLNSALEEVKNGETIVLQKDINIGNGDFDENQLSETKKGYIIRNQDEAVKFTIDLNGYDIITNNPDNSSIIVEDDSSVTIKGNGTIKNTAGKRVLWIKKGNITLQSGVTIALESGEKTAFSAIELGNEKFDIHDYDNGILTVENGVKVKSDKYGAITAANNITFNVEGGMFECVDTALATTNKVAGVNISISGGTIKGGTGVGFISNSGTLKVSGGEIIANNIAINSNNTTKNADIIITDGTIKGAVGIYKPQSGKMEISDGTIEGKIGIVARQGQVIISGGTIRATGNPSEKEYVGYKAHDLPLGTAIVVDNEGGNYGADITVVVKGGRFESTYETPLYSYQDEGKIDGKEDGDELDYAISGGSFDEKFDSRYVDEGLAEVSVTEKGEVIYYVGKDAQKAVNTASSGSKIDVLQGDIKIENENKDIVVNNSGEGNVTVNNVEVKKNEKVTIIDINQVTVTGIENKIYTGTGWTQNIAVKDGDKTLILGTDYEISYKNNINAGTADIILKGKGLYTGTKTLTFTIECKSIGESKVSGIVNKTYTGKNLTQNVKVVLDGVTLKAGTDYEVTYKNQKNPGKATVTIKGKGNYTGTITKTFAIQVKKVSGLKVKSQTTSSITLNWSKATGVSKYKLYKYNSSKKKWEKVTTTSKTSYTVKKLKAGTKYKFRVRAYKTISKKNYYGSYSSTLSTSTKTKTPSIKVKDGNKKATITWKKVSGASGYEVYMATSKNGKYSKIKTITKASTVKYTKSSLKKGKTYYFKVRAYRTVSSKKVYSSYSAKKSVRIKTNYIVKKGDNLTRISKKYKTTVKKLVRLNKIRTPNLIQIGLRLIIQ